MGRGEKVQGGGAAVAGEGANIDAKAKNGETVLHRAAENGARSSGAAAGREGGECRHEGTFSLARALASWAGLLEDVVRFAIWVRWLR